MIVLNREKMINDNLVYTLKKVMDLDFSGLLANCSDKGRTGYNPIMMYAVVTYANMHGIRAVDRIKLDIRSTK